MESRDRSGVPEEPARRGRPSVAAGDWVINGRRANDARLAHPSAGAAPSQPRSGGTGSAQLDGSVVERTLNLPPHPTSVHAAHRFVSELLRDAGRLPAMEHAVFLADELVADGLCAAGSNVQVTVKLTGGAVWVAVTDDGFDLRSGLAGVAEGGRGLALVSGIADAWGVTVAGGGKTVSFLVTDGRPTEAAARPPVPELRLVQGGRTSVSPRSGSTRPAARDSGKPGSAASGSAASGSARRRARRPVLRLLDPPAQ